MALNLDIRFETPEEHFLKHKSPIYELPEFDPKNLSKTGNLCKPADTKLMLEQQEVNDNRYFAIKIFAGRVVSRFITLIHPFTYQIILMVGSPGSGKSFFTRNHLKEYGYINRDALGSWQKCIVAVEQYLNRGESVVIDNTNSNPTSRERYTQLAKKHNVPIRCFVMTTSVEHAKHNNKVGI